MNTHIENPVLDVSDPLHTLVDAAEQCLGDNPHVFQRAGELVYVGKDGIKHISHAYIRYLLSQAAYWVKEDESVHPPTSVGGCILSKSHWSNVRQLRAITHFPILGKDGSINSNVGYHPSTSTYFMGGVECKIPSRITQEQAKNAATSLLDVVSDFPFPTNAHASSWLAALLSPLARFAHNGNTPLVVVQANAPRIGKTTLVHAISNILTGNDAPFFVHTKNEDEERKRILSFLRMGQSMVLIDNVVGEWGGAALNALATSRIFQDRVLSQSKVVSVINDTTLFMTANNVALAPDTAERCQHIRLFSDAEKPHLRSGFRYPDLLATIRLRRPQLLSAALCILKAYIDADCPDMKLSAWGSFEEWSRVVRGALVYAGMDDPAMTRTELEVDADIGRQVASALVEGWYDLQVVCQNPHGFTAKQAHDLLLEQPAHPLRGVLEGLTDGRGMPSTLIISRHLREHKNRPYGGKMLRSKALHAGAVWSVEEIKDAAAQ